MTKHQQDGPSLESSSYLNMTFRYLGPRHPWTINPGTFGLLDFQFFDLFPPPPPPHTSLYLLPLGLVWYGLVWGGGGYQMTSEFICEEISM